MKTDIQRQENVLAERDRNLAFHAAWGSTGVHNAVARLTCV